MFYIEIRFDLDDGTNTMGTWSRVPRSYATRERAERIAYKIECRNMSNGAICDTRVVEES